MLEVNVTAATAPSERMNVADRLAAAAAALPDSVAVACPRRYSPGYRTGRRGVSGADYATITFAELDADATRLARGLAAWGVPPGTRLALLVRPGIEFVTLVFAMLRAGMVIVLIDPGLGRRNIIRCLQEVEPEGFVAIGVAQAGRLLLRRKFPNARWNVTVGRRWFWGGLTLDELHKLGNGTRSVPTTRADDTAAIIFTSGSTGPPKGVLYTHRMFDAQVSEIQSMYGIQPGGVDLACFPLFALFNSAMGVTTVMPEMDFSRPAAADPEMLLAAANDWQVTQAFASPAVWRVVSEHCANTGQQIGSLRQVFSCGATVPSDVLRRTLACVADGAKMHTPYGATECLPVATIEAAEVLGETAAQTEKGIGVCVGRKFGSIDWRVIRITDEPMEFLDELPPGEIGELIVRGPQASPRYVTRTDENAAAKIADGDALWHRMGDVGYLDDHGRFWYCGRKSQRVVTKDCTLFTECVEAVLNRHPDIKRSALVGIGPRGNQLPVIALEFQPHFWITDSLEWEGFIVFDQIAKSIMPAEMSVNWMDVKEIPVDIRHNSKINRELLTRRAAKQFSTIRPSTPRH